VPQRQCLQVNMLLNKNLATGAESSAALIGDFQQSLWSVYTSFSQSDKGMLLNFCNTLTQYTKSAVLRTKVFFSLNGNIKSLNAQGTS